MRFVEIFSFCFLQSRFVILGCLRDEAKMLRLKERSSIDCITRFSCLVMLMVIPRSAGDAADESIRKSFWFSLISDVVAKLMKMAVLYEEPQGNIEKIVLHK